MSHDPAFLDQCVDHILAINRTNIEIQRGNFSSWWENRRRQDAFELARQEKLQKDIGRLTESAPPCLRLVRTGRRRVSSAWTRPGPRRRTGALWATRRPS